VNAQRKRICVVRHGYYPEDPRVYKEVRALIEAGYDVDVLCLSNPGDSRREQIEGVRVYRMPKIGRRGSKISYMLEYALSILMMGVVLPVLHFRYRYACIQVNTLPDALVFITVLPKFFGARILLDMHEPTPELMMTKYEGVHPHMLKLQCLMERLAIRYAHRVITVNDTIRQRFIERGADPDKIAVVRNVPPEGFGKTAPPRTPHPGFVIMTHGTLQTRYGQSLLLRVLPQIRGQIDGLRLIVAGPGETEAELKRLAKDLNCEDIVTFTGLVSRERIAELMSQTDVGIVPLLPGPFSELCQPNKLFEYMVLNVPVIAARLPAIEESFDDSCIRYFAAGDALDLAKAIVTLAGDARQRETLAANAFACYQPLCWREAKKEYVLIVDALIEPDSPHRASEPRIVMPTEINGKSCPAMRLFAISRRLFTPAALIAAGIVVGVLTGRLPPLLTCIASAGILVALITFAQLDLAFYLFFSGIVMMTDSAPDSADGSFFIPDADVIKGLPSILTTFFLLLFCVTVIRRIFLERIPCPVSLRGFIFYLIILLGAVLTGLFKGGNRELIYFDFMKMLFPVLCFYLCTIFFANQENISSLLTVLLAVSTIKALILSAAYLAGRGWTYQLDDTAAYQVTTTDSADLLVFITMLLIAVYLLVRRDITGVRAALVGAACLPLLFVIIFSYRRAQWVGLVFSMGLLFLGASKTVRKRIAILALAALFTGGAMAVMSGISEDKILRIVSRITSVFDPNQSSNRFHRLESQRVLLDIAASPLFGLGLGTNHSQIGHGMDASGAVPTNVVHNTFLYVWMKLGLPGFLFFLWAAWRYARRVLLTCRENPQAVSMGLLLPLAASSGLWLAMFLSSPVPWYLHQTFLIALFAAMGMSLIMQTEQNQKMIQEKSP
jgi:glycosyltransferase involved in cell wall biosynthesis/O-antigen ligase